MEINEDIYSFLTEGPVFVIATRDEHLRPSVTEGMGLIRSGARDELLVAFSSALSPETYTNLTSNKQVAVSLCTPADYRAIQIKGICAEVRAVKPEDAQEIGQWFDLRRRAVWMEGTSFEATIAIKHDVTHVARVVVGQVFDQTPGRNSGGTIV